CITSGGKQHGRADRWPDRSLRRAGIPCPALPGLSGGDRDGCHRRYLGQSACVRLRWQRRLRSQCGVRRGEGRRHLALAGAGVRVARLGYVSVPIDRPPIVSVEFFGDDEGHCFAWVHGVMIGPVLPPDLWFEVFRVPESWHVVHRVERQPLEAMTATSWPPPW